MKTSFFPLGLGYAALTVNAFIGFYYNVIIGYCIYYLFMSMRAKLPWSKCDQPWNTDECVVSSTDYNCTIFKEQYRKTLIKYKFKTLNYILNI